jgi:hypothetical protein
MTGSRKALLIATDSYVDPELSRLHAPEADVAGLYAVLSDPAIGGYVATQHLNGSEPGVTRALEDFFADASRDDLLLLYVSGHGVKDEDGQLYLAMADSRHDRLGSTSVPASFLHDQMRRSRCRRIVVLLDCCYSGAFPSGLRHRGADRVDVLSQLGGRGYAVMTSSSALEYSYETAGEAAGTVAPAGPSVFTGIIIDGLRTGEADLGGDGLIDIDELYDYAYDRVSVAVPGQTPQKKFELGGTIYIARSVRDQRSHSMIPPWPSPPAPVGADGNPAHPAESVGRVTAAALRTTPSEPGSVTGAARVLPGAARPLPGQSTAAEDDGEAQPRTGTPAPPGTPVTVRNSRQEMIGRDVGRKILITALGLGALGWMTHDGGLGPAILPGLFRPYNADSGTAIVMEIALAVFAGVLLSLISGLIHGALATSDTLTLDSAEFTITRRYVTSRYRNGLLAKPLRRDVYFWIKWSDIERIAVEHSKRAEVLCVWFRRDHEPPAGWLMANAIRTRADGSFDVYRGSTMFSHTSTVDIRRLRAQLPRYAGYLYDPS